MKRTAVFGAAALVIALALHVGVRAQQVVSVGDNANILPVYKSTPPGEPPAPDDYLRGNLLGQRCNEPSIGISPINRNTIMVFCNDYRATFDFDDLAVPAGKSASLAGAIWNGIKGVFARLMGRPAHNGEHELGGAEIEASTEAGIGGAVTYDGGRTWTGFMVPGGPNDNSTASLAHPGKIAGLQGYSDPAACSWKGSNGAAYIGLAYIGFTRDKSTGQSASSGIFFTRYGDRNSSDVLHNIEYQTTSTVGFSNNLTQGQFLDKVSCAVGSDGAVYVGFTRFTGSAGSSGMFLAKSLDGGLTWAATAIDKNSTNTQASVTVVNPTNSSQVGVLWRTFGTSSLVFKSPFAKGAKNIDLFLNDPGGAYRPFDQSPQSIVVPGTNPPQDDKQRIAFRNLSFPAAAYTLDGKYLVAAFTEWIDLATGKPPTTTSGNFMPMTVVKISADNGATWSARQVLNWKNGELGSVPAAPERLGFFSPARPVGAQLQPAIACAPGLCAVIWKQSFSSTLTAGGAENLGKAVKAGFDERFDVRGATVKFNSDGSLNVSSSFQVSRYGYRNLTPGSGEKPSDVHDNDQWIDKMTLPNGTKYSIVDYAETNHTGGGLFAFAGDYIDIENNTAPGQTPEFMVAFADNRFNIRPWQTPTGGLVPQGSEPSYYRYFQAPTAAQPLSCLNYGSRVQSVMTAKVKAGALLLTGSTNHKAFPDPTGPKCGPIASPNQQCIEFPLTVSNLTNQKKSVSIQLPHLQGSFAKRPWDMTIDPAPSYAYPLETGSVEIFPYGSYSTVVYAFTGNPLTVTATSGTDTATITFNDPNVVSSSGTSYTYAPSTVTLASGSPRAGSPRAGSPRAGSPRAGSPRANPLPDDPLTDPATGQTLTVYDIIDQTYVVTPSSTDDAGTYLSLFNIDPAYAGNYVFQVFVTNPLTSFMADQCAAFNWVDGALVGHISDASNPLVSGSPRAGSPRAGSPRAGSPRAAVPSDGDPLVQNTSFTLASSVQTTSSTLAATAQASTTGCLIDDCTLAAPRLPNEVTILVRAFQVQSTADIQQSGAPLYDPDGTRGGTPTPLSVAVAEYSCTDPSCVSALGPDLAVQTDPPPSPVTPTTVRAGGNVSFPALPIKNIGKNGDCGGTVDNPVNCGDAGAHQWGVYASTEPNFENLPRDGSGRVQENTNPAAGPIVVLVKSGGHAKLPCTVGSAPPNCDGATESAVVGDVTIPATIPRLNADGTGTYYLHFYDDRKRTVNELDETNNDWTSGAITVLSPGYGFLGLQTPCSGTTCDKTGTLPLAWQFTQAPGSTVPVDSVSTLPRVRFYASCPAPVDANQYPTGSVLATTEPNAADLTSGSSGWQYFPNAGMTRPQFTWQLNFDSTGLARGVCYSMYVEVPGTGQVIGSTNPALRPFGPFFITPR